VEVGGEEQEGFRNQNAIGSQPYAFPLLSTVYCIGGKFELADACWITQSMTICHLTRRKRTQLF
jgi:hypothetical protein